MGEEMAREGREEGGQSSWDLGGSWLFILKTPHTNNANGRGRGLGRTQTKLEPGSGEDLEQRREHFKNEGIKEGEIYAFILKKKKEKKCWQQKHTAHAPILHQTGKEKRATGRFQRGPSVGRTSIYELFKDYFHMTTSDIEELAVRDT